MPRTLSCTHRFLRVSKKRLERSPNGPQHLLGEGWGYQDVFGCVLWSLVPDSLGETL